MVKEKKGVVSTEVEKDELESDNIENLPDPTHEEIKEIFGLKKLSVHHSD